MDVSRTAAALIGIASTAGLFAAGCTTNGNCGAGKCPVAIFDLHALADSTVTWSVAGETPETFTGLVPYPPSTGQCSFRYTKGEIIDYADANKEQVIPGFTNIQCASVSGGGFDMGIRDPGDFRAWQAASWQMATAHGSVLADIGPAGAVGCNGNYFDGMEMTVTVETAPGGAAPFPKVVTDDYSRTFRLDFDTSTVTPTNNSGCSASLSALLSIHLTQTIADYDIRPDGGCACE